MNLETKITIYKFTPQLFTLTHFYKDAISDASIVPTPTQLTPKVKVRKRQ